MQSSPEWLFEPFRLEPANQRLWREGETMPLRPKAFALLGYLVGNPDRLVGKNELLDAVWEHRHVSESALEGGISELRKVLNDDARAPRYPETVRPALAPGHHVPLVADLARLSRTHNLK